MGVSPQPFVPETAVPPEPATPQVFVRTIQTPPAWPWEQSRSAALEARLGGPLPIADLMHRVQRLETWRPGQPGRYAVYYVRRKDYVAPFSTLVDVDGSPQRVAFGTLPRRPARLGRAFGLGAVGGLSVLALALMVQVVLSTRGAETEQLAVIEQRLAAKIQQAERAVAAREQSLALIRAKGDGATAAQVLSDLAWVTRARTSDARIVAVHWDRGLIGIEARGDTPPVAAVGRQVARSERPLRQRVWLWGVGPPEKGEPISAGFQAAPASAP